MSDVQQRIDDLVKSNWVMFFMKGTAHFPMCGFSGRAIQILKAAGLEPCRHQDLQRPEDEAVRQGIGATTPTGPPSPSSTSMANSSAALTS